MRQLVPLHVLLLAHEKSFFLVGQGPVTRTKAVLSVVMVANTQTQGREKVRLAVLVAGKISRFSSAEAQSAALPNSSHCRSVRAPKNAGSGLRRECEDGCVQ